MRQRWLGVAGLALAVMALAAPVAAQDWAGRGRISAIVLDDQAKPVEGASLKLRGASERFFTSTCTWKALVGCKSSVFAQILTR